jgi:hypothetical protein
VDSLLVAPKRVAGVTLHPMTMAHYLVLLKIHHVAVLKDRPDLSEFQWTELAWVLATDPREVVRVQQDGESAWQEAVVAFADDIRMSAFEELRAEVQRILREAFAPSPPADGGSKKKA